jgi:hypothetical protein
MAGFAGRLVSDGRDRCLGVDPGRREDLDRAVGLTDEQFDFGAAQDHALGTCRRQPGDHVPVGLPGRCGDHASARLVEDHPVHDLPVSLPWDQHAQAMSLHALLVEAFQHGEARAEQAYRREPGRLDPCGGRVDDVQQRHRGRRLHRRGHLVHGVGADQQQLGTGGLQPLGRAGQQLAGFVPAPAA